ncbi:probable membrane permease protein [Tepidicaulis marinus]|uniref:Probable membrane permease protein n=2 Tax=Tepidicaulis marinus TaxID=1333998 RepID=A0A081B932_9HYPH|nr:probable membrane permease protein [Tepidicaulis marinus]
MAYIVAVNPLILAEAGMDKNAVFVATCLAAAFGSLLMGLYANLPIAQAPGMGLNAYFAFTVVPALGGDWRIALGCVFFSGLIFLALSASPFREKMINAIPASQKQAIAAGIGLFLAFIGLQNAGIVTASPATLVKLGDMSRPEVWLAAGGFLAMGALYARKLPGAVLGVILLLTLIAGTTGLSTPDAGADGGFISLPPSLLPTFLELDLAGALGVGLVTVIFVFLLVDLLDTAGTLVAVAARAGFIDGQGRLIGMKKAMIADSAATSVGALLGTSTTTSYIESTSGIEAGGRTGLTAIVTGLAFLACLFFAPLIGAVPGFATAPALILVACLMMQGLGKVDWGETSEAIPATVTLIAIPLTFSIATGIGLGIITYAALKALTGQARQVHPVLWGLAAAFAIKLAVA